MAAGGRWCHGQPRRDTQSHRRCSGCWRITGGRVSCRNVRNPFPFHEHWFHGLIRTYNDVKSEPFSAIAVLALGVSRTKVTRKNKTQGHTVSQYIETENSREQLTDSWSPGYPGYHGTRRVHDSTPSVNGSVSVNMRNTAPTT